MHEMKHPRISQLMLYSRASIYNCESSGICLLCREDEETTNHMFIKCSCAKQVWLEVDQLSGVKER